MKCGHTDSSLTAVDPQSSDPATYRPIPCPLISWCVLRDYWPSQGRWSPELHYITTEEVIHQCSEVGWHSTMSLFFPLGELHFLTCDGDSAVGLKCLWKPKPAWEGRKQSRLRKCVCVSSSNDLLWQMISHKQTTSKPLVCPHKQTNKQNQQTEETDKQARPSDSWV